MVFRVLSRRVQHIANFKARKTSLEIIFNNINFNTDMTRLLNLFKEGCDNANKEYKVSFTLFNTNTYTQFSIPVKPVAWLKVETIQSFLDKLEQSGKIILEPDVVINVQYTVLEI